MLEKIPSISTIALLVFVVSGCAQQSAISIDKKPISVPESWSKPQISLAEQDTNWLNNIANDAVLNVVKQALKNNHSLQQQRFAVKALEQTALASGATLWPSLDLSFSNSRRKQAVTQTHSTSHELSLSLSYELDLWGKLSANDRQVNMQLASQKAQLEQATRNLIADVILAWFSVVEAKQQLVLSEKRYANSQQNLAIIESGYESGLNSALDVYLSRNETATEKSRVASQQSTYEAVVRQLELLIGDYPSGMLAIADNEIPNINGVVSSGVPSEVIANKPELAASWLSLLANDAALAYAHKQRFPSISLTAGINTSSEELGDLLSADLGWSLIGNITQPIFNAGRLKANEEGARFELKQAEQSYLEIVKNAFASVENGLTQEQTLQTSYLAYQAASENANLAEQLSFEQYLKGLVSYTTVLDAQTRAFNSQSSLIQSKYQLLENRLQLHLALGGNFNAIIANGSTEL